MAPEQHAGRTSDAAADQYSFCVTAFQVLAGRLPFDHRELDELARAKNANEVPPFPPESPVPQAIREAILRGLSADRSARWESVESLLNVFEAALEPPRRAPASAGGVLAGVLAVGLAVGLGLQAFTPTPRPICNFDASTFAGVWDDERRDALQESFRRTDLRFEADAAAGVVGHLDRWTEAWRTSREANCRATRIESIQSEQLLDRREFCLRRQLVEAGALIKRFVGADEQVVSRAQTLVKELPDLSRCDPVAVAADAHSSPPRNTKPRSRRRSSTSSKPVPSS